MELKENCERASDKAIVVNHLWGCTNQQTAIHIKIEDAKGNYLPTTALIGTGSVVILIKASFLKDLEYAVTRENNAPVNIVSVRGYRITNEGTHTVNLRFGRTVNDQELIVVHGAVLSTQLLLGTDFLNKQRITISTEEVQGSENDRQWTVRVNGEYLPIRQTSTGGIAVIGHEEQETV